MRQKIVEYFLNTVVWIVCAFITVCLVLLATKGLIRLGELLN